MDEICQRGYFPFIPFTQIIQVGIVMLQFVSRKSKVGFDHGLQDCGIPNMVESKRF